MDSNIKTLNMGCDWYDVNGAVVYGILVSNSHIESKFKSTSPSEETASMEQDDKLHSPLDSKRKAWVLEKTKGFQVYDVCDAFVLVTKNEIAWIPNLSVPGPHEIEDHYFNVEVTPGGDSQQDLDKELLVVAEELKPQGEKFSFMPGTFSFHFTEGHIHEFVALNEDAEESEAKKPNVPLFKQDGLPSDISLLVGTGDAQKTIKANRAILSCFVEGFARLIDSSDSKDQLELPDLDPTAVETVIDHHTTRKKNDRHSRFPDDDWSRSETDKDAIRAVYGHLSGSGKDTEPSEKRSRSESSHPALTEDRWLDASFLVGPDKTEIKANRASLAAMNPALKLMLYGSGRITVDTSKPIEWADFDPEAVRLVLLALLKRGNEEEMIIPIESSESGKRFADFLIETEESLKVYFETAYEREFAGGFSFSFPYDEEVGGRVIALYCD